METVLILSFGLLTLFGSLFGGFLARVMFEARGYMRIDARLFSLENSIKGQKSGEKRQLKDERLAQAIAEGSQLIQDGEKPMEVVKQLALKYPDIAMDLIKTGNIGSLKNLLN